MECFSLLRILMHFVPVFPFNAFRYSAKKAAEYSKALKWMGELAQSGLSCSQFLKGFYSECVLVCKFIISKKIYSKCGWFFGGSGKAVMYLFKYRGVAEKRIFFWYFFHWECFVNSYMNVWTMNVSHTV